MPMVPFFRPVVLALAVAGSLVGFESLARAQDSAPGGPPLFLGIVTRGPDSPANSEDLSLSPAVLQLLWTRTPKLQVPPVLSIARLLLDGDPLHEKALADRYRTRWLVYGDAVTRDQRSYRFNIVLHDVETGDRDRAEVICDSCEDASWRARVVAKNAVTLLAGHRREKFTPLLDGPRPPWPVLGPAVGSTIVGLGLSIGYGSALVLQPTIDRSSCYFGPLDPVSRTKMEYCSNKDVSALSTGLAVGLAISAAGLSVTALLVTRYLVKAQRHKVGIYW